MMVENDMVWENDLEVARRIYKQAGDAQPAPYRLIELVMQLRLERELSDINRRIDGLSVLKIN